MDEATIKLFDRKDRDRDRGKVEKQSETVKPVPQTDAPAKPAPLNETVNKPGAKSENPAGAGAPRSEPVIVPAQPNKTAP
jgi:hypothetical protein